MREMNDPFAEKRVPWRSYSATTILVVGLGLWYFGKFDEYLPIFFVR
jgi:hypothetical protein